MQDFHVYPFAPFICAGVCAFCALRYLRRLIKITISFCLSLDVQRNEAANEVVRGALTTPDHTYMACNIVFSTIIVKVYCKIFFPLLALLKKIDEKFHRAMILVLSDLLLE